MVPTEEAPEEGVDQNQVSPNAAVNESASERNRRLAEPIVHLRESIANKWKKVVRLTKKLKIHPEKKQKKKSRETEKKTKEVTKSEINYRYIKNSRASTDTIRQEIAKILAQEIPNRRKGVHLQLLLRQCADDVADILTKRDALEEPNRNLSFGFINDRKYKKLAKKVMKKFGDDSAENLALEGLLRACETWDPKESKLSTWAYRRMESLFLTAVSKKEGERAALSLDREMKGKSDDEITFAATLRDTRALEDQSDGLSKHEKLSQLDDALNALDPVLRRILELRMGLGENVPHSTQDAAGVLNAEGMRTKKGKEFRPNQVITYEQMALNHLKKIMKRPKDNEGEEGEDDE